MILYAHDLGIGGLEYIRIQIGNLILIDELLVIAPSLAMIAFGWWAFYPVDRQLREAMLIRRLDEALPIHPIWTRGQYLLSQFRHQMAPILVPLLILLAWFELVQTRMTGPVWGINVQQLLLLLGAGGIFLFTPVMIRHIWQTQPLPQGQMRDRLTQMCRAHRVGVRELLLWHTFGGMINAAVMGLFAPIRYILLTDALVESLPARQVEAVMAHEVAHVRRHHLFWLLAAAVALAAGLQVFWSDVLTLMGSLSCSGYLKGSPLLIWMGDQKSVVLWATAGSWFAVFGWVSRRFERQADTFAVQHLSYNGAANESEQTDPSVSAEAVATMNNALLAAAELNQTAPQKRSWRHGSMAWRRNYLRSLIGRPVHKLSIDRQMFWLKAAVTIMLLYVVAMEYLWYRTTQ